MRRACCVVLCLGALGGLPATGLPATGLPAQQPSYRDARLPVADRVRDLVGRMTLEEKFWQLFMIPGSLDDPSHDYSHGIFGLQISAGGRAATHADRINGIQRFFVDSRRS